MKSLWSGLGGIKEKAGEALNVAKKSLKEIASEPNEEEETRFADVEKEKLEKMFTEKLLKKDQEIQDLYLQIEALQKHLQKTSGPNELINFKIIIGLEDSAKALEIADEAFASLNMAKSEILIEKKKYSDLEQTLASAFSTIQSFEKGSFESQKTLEKLEERALADKKTIEEQQEMISSLQDSLLRLKKKTHTDVENCYDHLKDSFGAIGMSIPQIKPESLGLEDIQEFLFTQTQFITENITKISKSLIGKFEIKQIKSLDGVKDAVVFVVEESLKKANEAKEIANSAEVLFQQAKKEKIEILKKFQDVSNALDECKKIVGKKEEEISRLKKANSGLEELRNEYEKNNLLLKKANEKNASLEKEFNDEKKVFEKTYVYVSTLEEEHAEIKQKLKTQQVNIQEKDRILQMLNEEKSEIAKKHSETMGKAIETKSEFEEKIKEIIEKNALERKLVDDSHSQLITELQCSLSKALNDSKDINIAKIQVSQYQQGIEKLQDLVKKLESDLINISIKLEKKSQEIETLLSKLSKKKSKFSDLSKVNIQLTLDLKKNSENVDIEKKNIEVKLNEAEEMKKQAEFLLDQIQSKIQSDDNMIDRRLITTFLINFLNEENTEKMKLQMLRPLAEMLGMTQSERAKVGLEQQNGLLAQFTNFLTRG